MAYAVWGIAWQPLAALVVAGYILCAVYRLYLSPLAKFPGPKLAALTLWYEFFFDVVRTGTYMAEIKKMHEIYGEMCVYAFLKLS